MTEKTNQNRGPQISGREQAFVWGKLIELGDEAAALQAGYGAKIAKDALRIWSKPNVREVFAELERKLRQKYRKDKRPPNPNCSVKGCKTKSPHETRPFVRGLLKYYGRPEQVAAQTQVCIHELIDSVSDDLRQNRRFCYVTRIRQAEELYQRALYMLFVASKSDLPHIFSDEPPNSFTEICRKVNAVVPQSLEYLQEVHETEGDRFTGIGIMNSVGHASFAGILFAANLGSDPSDQERTRRHLALWARRSNHLGYIASLFHNGKSRDEVLEAIQTMHHAASAGT